MDENSLIREILAGQKEEFQRLINHYQNKIYNYIYKIIQNRTDAEDITQETFIKAYFGLRSFKKEFKFSTWLYKIATNCCWNFLKKKKPLSLKDEILDLAESQNKNPLQKIVEHDELIIIKKALIQLDPKYKIVIALYYFDELSLKEISQVLNLPEGTVKTHLYRAKNKLKNILEAMYGR
jgi:RNA polymerase sigma-70 factor, ECF subfamily